MIGRYRDGHVGDAHLAQLRRASTRVAQAPARQGREADASACRADAGADAGIPRELAMLRAAARSLEAPMRQQHSQAVSEAVLATMQAEDAEGSECFAVGAAAVLAELSRVADGCTSLPPPQWTDKGHERLAARAERLFAEAPPSAHHGNLEGTTT